MSKEWMAPVRAKGSIVLVRVSMNGANQLASSSIIGRRFTKLSIPSGRVNIHVRHDGKNKGGEVVLAGKVDGASLDRRHRGPRTGASPDTAGRHVAGELA